MLEIIVSILPVFIFLLFLIYLDSFKLVRIQTVISAIFWGIICAGFAYLINSFLISYMQISVNYYSYFFSPVIEESLKALFIVFLVYRNKIGFMIDGAILGFAVGAGFSLVENIYYLNTIDSTNFLLWIIRGFGTAVMHGGATALFSIIIMSSSNRSGSYISVFIGLASAAIIHGLYNSFIFSPLFSALILLTLLPLLISITFYRNELALRKWLEVELDTEIKLLGMIRDGRISDTRSGKYLLAIKDRFVQEVVFDILCYIRIYLELSIRAKTNLMLKESGFPVKNDDVKDKLNELKYLTKNIGKAGLLAISPILRMNKKDVWKLNQLN